MNFRRATNRHMINPAPPLLVVLSICALSSILQGAAPEMPPLRLSTFTADVTPSIGHGMMSGRWLASSVADLEQQLATDPDHFRQCLAAMGLSWGQRADAGHQIKVPLLDFQVAQLMVLPGESYVEYQFAAQRMKPDSFVCVAGYGEGATGYIPTEQHVAEGDPNLADWRWIAPGCEPRMLAAIRQTLQDDSARGDPSAR